MASQENAAHKYTGFPACVLGPAYSTPHPNHYDFMGAFGLFDSM